MHSLTFSLVPVVLVEIYGFKYWLYAGSHPCFLAWIEADPSPDQQHWVWL